MENPDDDRIRAILTETRVIAVAGYSANPDRPSHYVAQFLRDRGYRVIGVNPGLAGRTVADVPVYGSVADIPADAGVDMLDVFRRSEEVAPLVAEALAHLPDLRTVWTQIGVVSPEAAALAAAKGLDVVQNRCPKVEIPRLLGR